METVLSIGLGLGLSAACGFRVFVPLLALGIAAATGQVTLAGGFEWLGSVAALIILSVATVAEIAAYYVPWVDNLLDTLASPVAVLAGVVVTASLMTDVNPAFQWSTAVIGGGGVAGLGQLTTVTLRAASSAMTAGFGNPFLASAELGAAVGLSLLTLMLPLVGLLAVAVLAVVLAVLLNRRHASRATKGSLTAA